MNEKDYSAQKSTFGRITPASRLIFVRKCWRNSKGLRGQRDNADNGNQEVYCGVLRSGAG